MMSQYNTDTYQVLTTHHEKNDLVTPFILTDLGLEHVGKTNQPLLHFWTTTPCIILGMKDTRLPYFKKGIDYLYQENLPYVVRNAGGLAIYSDPHILNISLIIPEPDVKLSIQSAYDFTFNIMKSVIQQYNSFELEAYEQVHSYCPGTYDLNLNQQKIAGSAQRRAHGAIAVLLYLSISSDQYYRGSVVRSFYKHSLQEQKHLDYPDVDPNTMATLNDLSHQSITNQAVQHQIQKTIEPIFGTSQPITIDTLIGTDLTYWNQKYQNMLKRDPLYQRKVE